MKLVHSDYNLVLPGGSLQGIIYIQLINHMCIRPPTIVSSSEHGDLIINVLVTYLHKFLGFYEKLGLLPS